MKNLIITLLLLVPLMAPAQEKSTQAYSIHEDQVKPSMVAEYEMISKELIDNLKKHNIQGVNWLAASTTDFRYMFVSKIDNMADLDRPRFKELAEKMGKEALADLFDRMDKCYDKHGSYILNLDESLSYMPEGIDQNPTGQSYRQFAYWHIAPANLSAAVDLAKEIKALYAKKGSKHYYRIYRSGFGTMDSYFLVAIASKDATTFAMKDAENLELLGEEGQQIFGKALKLASKYEEVSGSIRADLSYMPVSN